MEKKFGKQFIQEIGSKPFISKCAWVKWHKSNFWRRAIAVAKVLLLHVLETSNPQFLQSMLALLFYLSVVSECAWEKWHKN